MGKVEKFTISRERGPVGSSEKVRAKYGFSTFGYIRNSEVGVE